MLTLTSRKCGAARFRWPVIALLLLLTGCACYADEAPSPVPSISITYREALEYVAHGGFDYERLRSSSDSLIVIREAGAKKEQPQDVDSAKAFWIDSYNRDVISSVLLYGITTSVTAENAAYFDAKLFYHFGMRLSLNDIEKRMLFGQFPDARLHFALVCGAESCPPLLAKPFSETDDLDDLLDSLTARSINDTMFVRFDHDKGEVLLSKLFDWYRKDYEKDAGSVIDFIAKYHDQGEKLLKRKWIKKYRDYDWSLNQRPRPSE